MVTSVMENSRDSKKFCCFIQVTFTSTAKNIFALTASLANPRVKFTPYTSAAVLLHASVTNFFENL